MHNKATMINTRFCDHDYPCMGKKSKILPVKRVSKASGNKRVVDLKSLDDSFGEIQRTRMTKSAAESRKAAKIVPTAPKIPRTSRELFDKTNDELSNLLKDF